MNTQTGVGETAGEGQPTPTSKASTSPNHAVELIATMSEVQEHAIKQFEQEASAKAANPTDKVGTRFDSSIHATDATGKPSLTAGGTYRKKPGRKTGSSPAKPTVSTLAPQGGVPGQAGQIVVGPVAQQNAVQVVETVTGALTTFFGDDFSPDIGQRAHLERVTGTYWQAKGWKDLPPGWAMVFAWSTYVSASAKKPKTAAKVGKLKTWLLLRVTRWKLRREFKKLGVAAVVEIVGDKLRIGDKEMTLEELQNAAKTAQAG